MATSFVFRQRYNRNSLGRRRFQVVLFCLWMVLLLITAGAHIPRRSLIVLRILPTVMLYSILSSSSSARSILVTSLDDRAMLKYNAEYDALPPEQQQDILSHYRVGTYIFPYAVADAEKEAIALSTLRAHHILSRVLLPLLAVYFIGWELLPAGYLRSCWTNGPIILGCFTAVVLGLPRLLHLWTWRDQTHATPRSSSTLTAS